MYFISSGAVEVAMPERNFTLGSGDFFGEIALIKQQPRIADVIALSYCKLLVLSRGDFQHFLSENPHLRQMIENTAEQRLNDGL